MFAEYGLQRIEDVTANVLMDLVKLGDIEKVSRLTFFCWPLDLQDKRGWTALHKAVYCTPHGSFSTYPGLEIVEILTEARADLEIQNNSGSTALKMARGAYNLDIVAALEAAGSTDRFQRGLYVNGPLR